MSIFDSMLSAGGGAVVQQLAGQFGITAEQATSSISTILPALAAGMKEKLAGTGGAELSQWIGSGSLTKFADDPASLASPEAVSQGNSLLNRIFGSQDLSNMTGMVAEKAGVSSGIVSKLLPVAATLFASFLSKSSASGGNLTDLVGQFASAGQGGVMDTVKSLASKVFGGGA